MVDFAYGISLDGRAHDPGCSRAYGEPDRRAEQEDLHSQQRPVRYTGGLGVGDRDQDQEHGQDHYVVSAGLDVQGLAHGARYALVAHHVAQDYWVGRGQDGAQEQRLHHRGPEQKVRPRGHDRDDDQGPRTQREYRDGAGALHALVPDPHAFEAQDQGQRERSHRLQERALRTEIEDAQTMLTE